MGFQGDERRIHKVFVTRNTEYHVRKNHCVAVKDRKSGRFLHGHIAIDTEVSGGLAFLRSGAVRATDSLPGLGESLFFCTGGRDLVTSPVMAIERPAREVVSNYQL